MAISEKTLTRISLLGLLACAGLAPAADGEIPRTPWGAPDLNGVWDFAVSTPLERPDELGDQTHYTEEEAAAFMAV